jgi:predicted RNA-binding protein with PUA-like domain
VTPLALLGNIRNMQHWLVKQEPEDYSWTQFVKDGTTSWTGVRNFQARNNLRTMKAGDWVFYYHSGAGKEIVGLARVKREAHPDPTADEGDWVSVDLEPVRPLAKPVSLGVLKADRLLKDMVFVKQSRLSVSPVLEAQFKRILELGSTKLK